MTPLDIHKMKLENVRRDKMAIIKQKHLFKFAYKREMRKLEEQELDLLEGIAYLEKEIYGEDPEFGRSSVERKARPFRGSSLFLALMLLVSVPAMAKTYDPEVRCIIGEASNQGKLGMDAVASGIRNRGHLRGVYGCKAKHVDKEPKWVWEMAEKAWIESEHNRIHSGDHWENLAFGKPYWVDSMVKVYEHKDHVFYKETN